MKNKKAQLQIPGTLVDFYSYVVFVLVILLFLLLFSIKGCKNENTLEKNIQDFNADSDKNLTMLNILRTPVLININFYGKKPILKNETVGDILATYELNNHLLHQIFLLLRDIFGEEEELNKFEFGNQILFLSLSTCDLGKPIKEYTLNHFPTKDGKIKRLYIKVCTPYNPFKR